MSRKGKKSKQPVNVGTSDSPTDPQVAIGGDPNDQSAHVTETILKILWTIKL